MTKMVDRVALRDAYRDGTELTPRQREIHQWMLDYQRDNITTPTIRQIGEAFNIVSPNGVIANLKRLLAKGYVKALEHAGGAKRPYFRYAAVVPGAREPLTLHRDGATYRLQCGGVAVCLSAGELKALRAQIDEVLA